MPLTIKEQLAPTWWKIDENDQASAEFLIRPLSSLEFIDVQNEGGLSRGGKITLSAVGIRSALVALIEWRNVLDSKGQPMDCTSVNKEKLPKEVLQAIAGRVLRISLLTEDAKKN